MTANRVCWLIMAALWLALLAGFQRGLNELEGAKAAIEEVRSNVWCPKLYRGMRLEWRGETNLYNSASRTFSCRYAKGSAT